MSWCDLCEGCEGDLCNGMTFVSNVRVTYVRV